MFLKQRQFSYFDKGSENPTETNQSENQIVDEEQSESLTAIQDSPSKRHSVMTTEMTLPDQSEYSVSGLSADKSDPRDIESNNGAKSNNKVKLQRKNTEKDDEDGSSTGSKASKAVGMKKRKRGEKRPRKKIDIEIKEEEKIVEDEEEEDEESSEKQLKLSLHCSEVKSEVLSEDCSPVNFFYKIKGRGKGKYEDLENERQHVLRQIKKLHKPPNYEKLKKREKEYFKTLQETKERRKLEISQQMIEIQKSTILPKFKSRDYEKQRQSYVNDRNAKELKRKELFKIKQDLTEYGKRMNQQNQKFLKSKDKNSDQNDQTMASETSILNPKYKNYGRFAKETMTLSIRQENIEAYMKKLNTKGNNYMENSRFNFDHEQIDKLQQRRRDKLVSIDKDKYKTEKKSPSIDYLQQLRERRENKESTPTTANKSVRKRLSKSFDCSSNNKVENGRVSSLLKDVNTPSRSEISRNNSVANQTFQYERQFEKYDGLITQNEQHLKCQGYKTINKIPSIKQGELKTYMTQSIHAKQSYIGSQSNY